MCSLQGPPPFGCALFRMVPSFWATKPKFLTKQNVPQRSLNSNESQSNLVSQWPIQNHVKNREGSRGQTSAPIYGGQLSPTNLSQIYLGFDCGSSEIHGACVKMGEPPKWGFASNFPKNQKPLENNPMCVKFTGDPLLGIL